MSSESLPTKSRRPRRRLLIGLALVVAVVVAVAGFVLPRVLGGSVDTGDLEQRVAAAPAAERGVIVIDLAAARKALGLAEDADPLSFLGRDVTEAERRFTDVVLAAPYVTNLLPGALHEAIDLGQATAAATTVRSGGTGLAVLATDQEFDEIARALEAEWDRDGDLLSYTGDDLRIRPTHLAYGDGVLALGDDPEIVSAAVTGPPEDSALATQVAELQEETDAAAVAVLPFPPGSCAQSLAMGDPFDGPAELILTGGGAELALGEGLASRWRAGSPVRDGDRVRVSLQPDEQQASPLGLVLGDAALWSCT